MVLCEIVKTLPYQARKGRCKMPLSIIRKHDLNLKEFTDFKNSDALINCVKEMVTEIESLITQARSLSKEGNAILLSTVSIEDYLKRLKKVQYDPFNPNIGGGRLSRQIKLGYKAWRGTY